MRRILRAAKQHFQEPHRPAKGDHGTAIGLQGEQRSGHLKDACKSCFQSSFAKVASFQRMVKAKMSTDTELLHGCEVPLWGRPTQSGVLPALSHCGEKEPQRKPQDIIAVQHAKS